MTVLLFAYFVMCAVGTMIILVAVDSPNRAVRHIVITAVLAIMVALSYLTGYTVAHNEGVEENVSAPSFPVRPVLDEDAPQSIPVPRMDPALQRELKEFSRQRQEPEPVLIAHSHDEPERDVQAAQSGPVRPWDALAECESNGQWDYNPNTADWGNGLFEGGIQFHPNTWDAFKPDGYPDAAYNATKAQQIEVGKRVQAAQGWKAWPKCSKEIGLR